MATATVTPAAQATVASKSGKAATKKKAASTPASHPKYIEMVQQALTSLKERGGSSRQAVLKYIMANFKVGNDESVVNTHLKMALKAGVKSGSLKQSKGTGASGSFRIGEKPKKAATPKAKKPKPAAPKKAEGKPAAKKASTGTTKKKAAKESKPKAVKKATKSPAKKESKKPTVAADKKKAVGASKKPAAPKAAKATKKAATVAKKSPVKKATTKKAVVAKPPKAKA